MYLHIINVMRRFELPSLDVSFSTYLPCTNYQAGLFPGMETKMLVATPVTVYTIDTTNVSLSYSQSSHLPLLTAKTFATATGRLGRLSLDACWRSTKAGRSSLFSVSYYGYCSAGVHSSEAGTSTWGEQDACLQMRALAK